MGLFNRSKSKSTPTTPSAPPEATVYNFIYPSAKSKGRARVAQLPSSVLSRIFTQVCPHARDESYVTCDDSLGDSCMLCQACDLSQCAQVCRSWCKVANALLYHSVRIDSVHFCGLENARSDKKKSKGKSGKGGTVKFPEERLRLFAQTVRDTPQLAGLVRILKIAYMTRESCKADLARTVALLPNLHYVDLPEGVFSDDSTCMTLKQELEIRCVELRKMKYLKGSERAFAAMGERMLWRHLEALEIEGVSVEADALLHTLASFPALREIKLGGDMMALNDDLFTPNPSLSTFPAVERLVLEDAPSVTAKGLCAFLSRSANQRNLLSLTLKQTGVLVPELHLILSAAPRLLEVSISETVPRPLPSHSIVPLASISLETLFFGILPEHLNSNQPLSESYYTYLAGSLISNSLPALRTLFAYSDMLPATLSAALLPGPDLPFAGGHSHKPSGEGGPHSRFSAYSIASYYSGQAGPTGGFRMAPGGGPPVLNLDLYTKPPSTPELEWSLTELRSAPIPVAPASAPAQPNYKPSHFSTPNPPFAAHSPKGSAGSGIAIGQAAGGIGANGPLSAPPMNTVSSTRPLSVLYAEQQKRGSPSSRDDAPGGGTAMGAGTGAGAAANGALAPPTSSSGSRASRIHVDGSAVGRIGSGRVVSGRFPAGIGFGGFLAQPRAFEEIDPFQGQGQGQQQGQQGHGHGLGHGHGQGQGRGVRGSRRDGLVGDWMG